MNRRSLSLLLLVLFAAPTRADYILERRAAMVMMQARQYTEALEAFRVMAADDVTDLQQSDALTQAACCAALSGDYDVAMEIAQSIPLTPESKAAQMQVMHIGRQWREMCDVFGEEDLRVWPDYVANEAFRVRGMAAMFTRDYEQAIADFEAALRFPMGLQTRGTIMNHLGASFASLGREDRALEIYHKSLRIADEYRAAGAAIAIASIHTARGEHDKASKILDTVDMDMMKSVIWRCLVIAAHGDVLLGTGDTAGAIAQYEKALAVEGIPDHFKTRCEKKIEALRPDAE